MTPISQNVNANGYVRAPVFSLLKNQKLLNFLWVVGWVAFIVYGLIHLIYIVKTAINIPFMDEWNSLFNDFGIIQGWSRKYILEFHSEHRIVWTKILYLINLSLFHLNIRYQIIFNAAVYFFIILIIWRTIGRKIEGPQRFAALLAMTIFISTLPYENHTWAFQFQFHLFLIAFVGGAYFLYLKNDWASLFLGLTFWFVSIFSFSGGVAAVAVASITLLLWNPLRKERLPYLKIFTIIIFIGFSLWAWFQGYQKNPGHPPYIFPWELRFYKYFAEIISLGFGFTKINPWIAIICSATILFTVVLTIIQVLINYNKNVNQTGFLLGVLGGILAILALTSFGRAGFPVVQAKSSRYAEISIFLPILTLALISQNRFFKNYGALWVTILMLIGINDNFGLRIYREIMTSRKVGAHCVKNIIRNPQSNPSGNCPPLFPSDIRPWLKNAEKLEVSFFPSMTK